MSSFLSPSSCGAHALELPKETDPTLLDCITHYGAHPFGCRAGLPQSVTECPSFADRFFEPAQGKVLLFSLGGSQALIAATAAGFTLTHARPNLKIAASVYYGASIGFFSWLQPNFLLRALQPVQLTPPRCVTNLKPFLGYTSDYTPSGRFPDH